ncbi:MAG: hypothetical protein C0606_01910 [Hyphomicrobiales bacterium]|nr:MAG: hypothetical protein C0606_01910 [Hyphomicrobiales bacterium]
MRLPTIIVALATSVLAAGCAGQSSGKAKAWYATHGAAEPTHTRVVICHGFGCYWRTPFQYSDKDLTKIRRMLAGGGRSPKAERAAMAKAVAWAEKRVAPIVGSANDIGGFDASGAGVRGQMDCIDEATNTTSLLKLAEKRGWLKHHRVTTPVARGFFLDGRYPHATAVVVEKTTGTAYAIDSWPRANGHSPDVMALDDWFASRSSS